MRRLVMVVFVLSAIVATGCDCCQPRSYAPVCCPTYRQPVVGTQAAPVYTQQQGCVPVCR